VLSGNKLLALAKLLLHHGQTGTITRPELADSIDEGIQCGEIPEGCRKK
jgi:hypothetical protein